MTYGDLRPQIQRNVGNRDDADSLAIILATFNFVQRAIAIRGEWDDLKTIAEGNLTATVSSYPLISGSYNLGLIRPIGSGFYSIKLNDGSNWRQPLTLVLSNKWDENIVVGSSSSGLPTRYTIWGRTAYLDPTPDDAYAFKVRYIQYPTPIDDDSTVVQLESLDQILVAATTGFCWATWEEPKLSQYWLSLASNMAKEFIGTERGDFNFLPFSAAMTKEGSGGDYWADPFVSSAP